MLESGSKPTVWQLSAVGSSSMRPIHYGFCAWIPRGCARGAALAGYHGLTTFAELRMSDLILHHYPPSPVSEKIRAALGFKGLAWHSVEQNRLPDRPELFAMTGGYRRIPVLQVGADIYCDTQLIFRELEARAPKPSLFPAEHAGLGFALSRWIDGELFELCVRVAFAPVADQLPPALIADRTSLYFGPDGDMAKEAADLPHTLSQLRTQLGWLEQRLVAGGTPFLLGDKAGHADLLAWYCYWFVRGRYADSEAFLAPFPALGAWAARMEAFGHGDSTDMTPADALAVALGAQPETAAGVDATDPLGLSAGAAVSVIPMSRNDVEKPVEGVLHALSAERVSLARQDAACGEVVVHFPRVGYRVSAG